MCFVHDIVYVYKIIDIKNDKGVNNPKGLLRLFCLKKELIFKQYVGMEDYYEIKRYRINSAGH